MKLLLLMTILCALSIEAAKEKAIKPVKDKDMMRKMIIYDKKNPNMFYCPVPNKHLKSYSIDKMIVKAHPLAKLCEYEGAGVPEGDKSDCYQNVDETEFACKEKYRIMKRIAKYNVWEKSQLWRLDEIMT